MNLEREIWRRRRESREKGGKAKKGQWGWI
jgi:hypothetical protein